MRHVLVPEFLEHLVSEYLSTPKQLRDVLVGLGASLDRHPTQCAHAVGDHGQGVPQCGLAVALADLVNPLHGSLEVLEDLHACRDVGFLRLGRDEQELPLCCEGLLHSFCLSQVRQGFPNPAHCDSSYLAFNYGTQLAAQVHPGLELGIKEVVEGLNGRR